MISKLANKTAFAAILASALAACTSTTTNININAANNSAAANANAVSQTSASTNAAPDAAPEALVADLYKQHDAGKSPFFQDKNRALVDKYFAKATADKIWSDAANAKGEAGALNADPLYDAQDTEIKNFKVGQSVVKGSKAEVPVTFENFGKRQTVTYLLVKENDNWKIEDIKYQGGYNLVGMFKKDVSSKKESSPQGEFEGKYQVGDTTATVKPIKMAFEVKWEKGTGTEIFFFEDRANDKIIFASDPGEGKKANVFAFTDENYDRGTFYRADGKEFPVSRIR